MSRTALRCFLALGISISFAAACGDDEGGDGSGGSAGSAGSAGSGTAGSSGSGGEGGTSGGSAGSAGESGSSGAAGQGGAQGGDGGSSGSGGSGGEEPDAGDGGLDGSVVEEPDASTGGTGGSGTGGTGGSGTGGSGTGGTGGTGSTADCPADQNDIETTADVHELAIMRVLFDGAGQVVIRNVIPPVVGDAGGTSVSLQSVFLCNGPDDCVDLGADGDCDETGDEDEDLLSGEEATCSVPGTLAEAGGELALLNAEGASENSFVRSYVAWGATFVSEEPARDAGTVASLEDRAVEGDFWTLGDRVAAPTGGEDAIYATGVLNVETGYTVCTED